MGLILSLRRAGCQRGRGRLSSPRPNPVIPDPDRESIPRRGVVGCPVPSPVEGDPLPTRPHPRNPPMSSFLRRQESIPPENSPVSSPSNSWCWVAHAPPPRHLCRPQPPFAMSFRCPARNLKRRCPHSALIPRKHPDPTPQLPHPPQYLIKTAGQIQSRYVHILARISYSVVDFLHLIFILGINQHPIG